MRVARIHIRAMMIVVAVLAVLLWVGMTAYRVATDPNSADLTHVWADHRPEDGGGRQVMLTHAAPFLPQFWRRLLGQPWPGTFVCPDDELHKPVGYSDFVGTYTR